jgi:antitoxin VapB
MKSMTTERHVRLFRNGRNQALRIPGIELQGTRPSSAGGDRLIIDGPGGGLLAVLSRLQPLDVTFRR